MPNLFSSVQDPLIQGTGTVTDYETTALERFGAEFGGALDTNPLAQGARMARYGIEANARFFGLDSNMVSPEVAKEELKSRGLEGHITVPEGGMSRVEFDSIQYLKQRELSRQAKSAMNQSTFAHVAGFAGGLAGSAIDPINIASAFVPIVREARLEAMLAKAGSSVLGRAGVRAQVGATEGVVGALMIEPFTYAMSQYEQMDYTPADSFMNVVFGGLLGGGLHMAGGAVYDWRATRALNSLQRGLDGMNLRDMAPDLQDEVQLDILRRFTEAEENGAPLPDADEIIAQRMTPDQRSAVQEADGMPGEVPTPTRADGQPSQPKGLDELIPEAKADRTAETFNRQFLDKEQGDVAGFSDVRPPREDIFEVAQANFVGRTQHTAKTVPIDQLSGGVSADPAEAKRVSNLVDLMSGPNGYLERLIVDTDGNVIEGQHRLEALRKMGVKEVPVIEIRELREGLPVDRMMDAMQEVRGLHRDQARQIIDQIAEAIADVGSVAEVRAQYAPPRGFERAWEAALNAAEAADDLKAQSAPAKDASGKFTEAFWRWFKDSKVVDADGNPLVVYHGGSFDEVKDPVFKLGRSFGFFFTPNKKKAQSYAPGMGKDVPVTEAYLSLQNPFMPNDASHVRAKWVKDWIDFWRERDGWVDRQTGEQMEDYEVFQMIEDTRLYEYEENGMKISERWDDFLRTAQEHHDGFFGYDPTDGAVIAVAFKNTQIKSATGNRGTYDPELADIRAQSDVVDYVDQQTFEQMAAKGKVRQARSDEQDVADLLAGRMKANDFIIDDSSPFGEAYEMGDFTDRFIEAGFVVADDKYGRVFIGRDQASVDALMNAKTPLEYGEAYGYSPDDIARFYLERRGGDVAAAFDDYRNDLEDVGRRKIDSMRGASPSDAAIMPYRDPNVPVEMDPGVRLLTGVDRSPGIGDARPTLADEFGLGDLKMMGEPLDPADGPDAPKVIGTDAAGRPVLDFRNSVVSHFTDQESADNINEFGYRVVGDGYYGEAISFTPNREFGAQFGGVETTARISPDARILQLGVDEDWKMFKSIIDQRNVVPNNPRPGQKSWRQAFVEKGIDGVYDAGAGDLFIYNERVVRPTAMDGLDDLKTMIAGEKALTADLAARDAAEDLLFEGETDLDEIWRRTGWGRSPDNFPIWEIDDSKSEVADFDAMMSGKEVTLGSVFKHDELYAAYPSLRDVIVAAKDGMKHAAEVDLHGKTIRIDLAKGRSKQEVHSTILHEINHVIQKIEGFDEGGSPKDIGYEAYNRLIAEVASRNVQARMALSKQQRREIPLDQTQDILSEDQLRHSDVADIWKRGDYMMFESVRQSGDKWYPVDGLGQWSDFGFATKAEAVDAMRKLNSEKAKARRSWAMTKQTRAIMDEDGGIDVWHGSPHDFDKFRMSKIGTGEGAQAFSHALYFGEARGTGEFYRDMLVERPNTDRLSLEKIWELENEYLSDRLLKGIEMAVENSIINERAAPKWDAVVTDLRSRYGKEPGFDLAIKTFEESGFKDEFDKPRGKLYKVKLRVRPTELLDWDAKLSDQPKDVQAVFRALPRFQNDYVWSKSTFGEAYGELAGALGGKPAATERLLALGYKGVKYLDELSRDAGKGTSNIAVWDEDVIDIIDKFQSDLDEQPDLVAAHNLTAANLLHADKMGGIAAPSLAIAKASDGHEGYGEITLIGSKDLVDPQKGANVYAGDIYSARYPTVHYNIKYESLRKLDKQFAAIAKEMGVTLRDTLDDDALEREGPRALENSVGALLAYAKEKGVKVDGYLFDRDAWEVRNNEAQAKERAIRDEWQAKRDEEQQRAKAEGRDPDETALDAEMQPKYMEARREANSILREPDRALDEIKYKLRDKFRNDSGFAEWAEGKFAELKAKERIFKGFSNTTGAKMYTAHTLDNVVKLMTKKIRDAEGFNYGIGNLRAKVAPKFRSVEAIRGRKGSLVKREEFDAIKKEADAELISIADQLLPKLKYKGNSFGQLDALTQHMAEAIDRNNVKRVFQEYYNNLTDDDVRMVGNFLQKLKTMPTTYFEAKLDRAVQIGEFEAAIVPNTISKKAREVLERSGVKQIIEYDPAVDGSRQAAIDSIRDMKFQRDVVDVNAKDTVVAGPYTYTKMDTERRQRSEALRDAIEDLITKYTGGRAQMRWYSSISQKAGGKIHKVDGGFSSLRGLIIMALDAADMVGSAKHEALHFLKDRGFISDVEWDTLVRTALREGWMDKKYGGSKLTVRQRYAHLPNMLDILEEAIAEQFRAGRYDNFQGFHPAIRPILIKLRKFFDAVAKEARKIFGMEATAEDIFRAIESGEIGRRADVEKAKVEAAAIMDAPQRSAPQQMKNQSTPEEDPLRVDRWAADDIAIAAEAYDDSKRKDETLQDIEADTAILGAHLDSMRQRGLLSQEDEADLLASNDTARMMEEQAAAYEAAGICEGEE